MNFDIGHRSGHPTLYQNNFAGQLDELYIWSRALDTAEIEQIYNDIPNIGDHTLKVQATDFAGNVGSDTINYYQPVCQ